MHVSHPSSIGAGTEVVDHMNPSGRYEKGESQYEIQAERFTYGAAQPQAGVGGQPSFQDGLARGGHLSALLV